MILTSITYTRSSLPFSLALKDGGGGRPRSSLEIGILWSCRELPASEFLNMTKSGGRKFVAPVKELLHVLDIRAASRDALYPEWLPVCRMTRVVRSCTEDEAGEVDATIARCAL